MPIRDTIVEGPSEGKLGALALAIGRLYLRRLATCFLKEN